jgi:hypothetical protein
MRSLKILVVLIGCCLFGNVAAAKTSSGSDTPEAACSALKLHMAKLLIPSRRPDPEWFCEHTDTGTIDYHIIALRKPRGTGEEIYSSLIGWFAVARRSHKVFQWDFENDRAVPISPKYSLKPPPEYSLKPPSKK